jgi:hypothetical protein
MRTIVDIPEESLKQLAIICQQESISRAEVIRRAVDDYTKARLKNELAREAEFEKVLAETAGAWKDDPFWKGRDSVEYVRSIRDEWEDPWEKR